MCTRLCHIWINLRRSCSHTSPLFVNNLKKSLNGKEALLGLTKHTCLYAALHGSLHCSCCDMRLGETTGVGWLSDVPVLDVNRCACERMVGEACNANKETEWKKGKKNKRLNQTEVVRLRTKWRSKGGEWERKQTEWRKINNENENKPEAEDEAENKITRERRKIREKIKKQKTRKEEIRNNKKERRKRKKKKGREV